MPTRIALPLIAAAATIAAPALPLAAQAHTASHGQSQGQPHGQSHGQSQGQSQGQPHGQSQGQPQVRQQPHHGPATPARSTGISAAATAELARALAAPHREKDRARDAFRHPAETLAFFQVEPGMAVGEYAPGGGWYSRVLGGYLGPRGQLVGLYFTPENGVFDDKARDGIRKGAAGFAAQVEGWTARPAAGNRGLTLDTVAAADKGTLDRVLVIRMMHNMMRWNFADSELKALRDLLKPGGLLGVVQHRARPDAPGDYANGTKGYLRQKDVIGIVEAAGFELVASSEINANPRDRADHAGGVWEMPPTLATKNPAFRDLGESDRMTLLFRKR